MKTEKSTKNSTRPQNTTKNLVYRTLSDKFPQITTNFEHFILSIFLFFCFSFIKFVSQNLCRLYYLFESLSELQKLRNILF